MANQSDDLKDFFISYNVADEEWAVWISWQLEDAGFSVIVQAWDFRPGNNFVIEMDSATKLTRRTIVVLSPNYLSSSFTPSEWATAFARDPKGEKGLVVPVLVEDCDVEGLLGPTIHINIIGELDEVASAKLLAGVQPGRSKPSSPPIFPGSKKTSNTTLTSQPKIDLKENLEWKPFTPMSSTFWSNDLPNTYGRSSGGTRVEIELVPAEDILLQVRQLNALPDELVTLGRQRGVFTPTEELSIESSSEFAYAKSIIGRNTEDTGLMVTRRGQLGAWISLPSDSLGSVLDEKELAPRLAVILRLLMRVSVLKASRYGIAVSMGPVMMLTVGSADILGKRSSASMSLMDDQVIVDVQDSVRSDAIESNVEELADEIVARLISETKH